MIIDVFALYIIVFIIALLAIPLFLNSIRKIKPTLHKIIKQSVKEAILEVQKEQETKQPSD